MTRPLIDDEELRLADTAFSGKSLDLDPELVEADRSLVDRRSNQQTAVRSALAAPEISLGSRAEAIGVSERSGLPVDTVERDLHRQQGLDRLRALDFGLIDQNDALRRLFGGPMAPVAASDMENLTTLANGIPVGVDEPAVPKGSLLDVLSARTARGPRTVEQGRLGVRVMYGLASDLERQRFEDNRRFPVVVPQAEGPVAGPLSFFLGPVAEQITGPLFHIGLSTLEGAAVGGGFGAAAGGALAGPGGAAVGAVTFGTIGGRTAAGIASFELEAGNAYDEFLGIAEEIKRETGEEIPHEAIVGAATLVGGVNGALEFVGARTIARFTGLGKLMDALNKKGGRGLLTDRALRDRLVTFGKGLIKTAAVEGGTEGVQEAMNIVGGNVLVRMTTTQEPDLLTAENGIRILDAATEGAIAGGGVGVVAGPFGFAANEARRVAVAQRKQKGFDGLVEAAGNSQVREASPTEFRATVQRMAEEGGGDLNVYVDAQEFVTYFQEQEIDIESLGIPDVAAQVPEAIAAGGELVIPISDYLTHLTEHHEALGPNVRHAIEDLTPREAEAQEEGAEAALEAEIAALAPTTEEAPSPAEAVTQEFFEQLVRSGRMTPDQARVVADLFRASVERRALGPAGETAIEQARRLRVEGPVPQEPEVRRPRPSLEEVLRRAREQEAQLELPEGVEAPVPREFAGLLREIREGLEPELQGLPKKPVLSLLKRLGGVDPSSPLATELELAGLERRGPGSLPGLFRKGGLTSLDELDLADREIFVGNILPAEAGGARLDPNEVLNAIQAEIQGQPLRTETQQQTIATARLLRGELADALAALDIDLAEASDREVLTALQEIRPAEEVPEGVTLEQDERVGPRGSISFDPELQNVVIRLTEASNLSTALHEMGHLFLEFLRADSQLEGADPQLGADLQTALDFIGAESVDSITNDQHEKWARAFEAYLEEGVAPSVELQSAFQRFRAWMLQVYRRLLSLNVGLHPEIRQVFDRLLATDEAIREAREAQGLLPAFDSAESAGMTEAEFRAYEESLGRVQAEAQETIDKQVLVELNRVRTEQWKRDRKAVRAEVEADINDQPVFQAKHWLQTGEFLDRGTPEGLEHRKLNRDELVRRFGKPILNLLPGRGKLLLWQKEGGIHHDEVADLFGFPSGDALINALQASGNRLQVIEQETDARMKERFGDILTDGSLGELALEASETNAQGQFLLREVRALARRSGQAPTPARVARDAARRIIGEKRVRALRPDIHRKAEARMARAAAEAIAARDFETAHDAKRKQLLNHYLALEATRARDQAKKDRDFLTTFSVTRVRQRIGKAGQSFLDQIDSLLDRFDFRQISNIAADRRQALAAFIEEQEAELGGVFIIDPRLRDETFRKPWRDLTVNELTGVSEAVRNLDHIARERNKIRIGDEKVEFEETRDGLVQSVVDNNRPIPPSRNISEDFNLVRGLSVVHAWHTKMEFLFEKLDGHKKLGPLWQALFRPFVETEAAETERMKALAEQWVEIFGPLPKVKRAGLKVERVYVPEVGKAFTREELMVVGAHMGNEGNRTAILEGSPRGDGGKGWTESMLQAVLKEITEEEWVAINKIWKLLDSFYPEIAELERRVTGVAPKRVEPIPVNTKFGTFAGGYYPLKANPDSSFRAFVQSEFSRTDQLFENNWARAMTRHGHTIERVGFGGQEVYLSFSVLSEHFQNVIHDLTHREAIVRVDKLTRDRQFAGAVRGTAGTEAQKLFRPWLQSIAGDVRTQETPYDRLIAHGRAGVTITYMGIKFTTAFSQLAGVLPAIDRVGLKPIVESYALFFRHPGQMKDRVDFALERSSLLRNRQQNFDREARDLLRRGALRRGKLSRFDPRGQEAKKAFMYLTGLMDMSVSVPTWLAAYQQGMLEFDGNEARAIQIADQAVRFSQGTGSVKDLSRIQRGGELLRLFSAFYTYFATFYNQLGNRIDQIRRGQLSVAQAAASMFWIWFGPALLSEIVAGRGPEEDEEWWVWAATELGRYPFLGVVGVRDAVGHGINMSQGKPFDFKLTPLTNAIEAPIAAFVNLGLDLKEGELRRSTVRHLFEAVGFWGLLPGRQLWITSQAFYDLMTDQGEVLPQDFLFTRPLERRAR